MSNNTKKKLAAVMFCKFVDYDKYVQNDKKLAIKILSDYDLVITKNVKKKTLALTRASQIEIKNYRRKKK